MAITEIYGFQNFTDVLDKTYQDFSVFGKLPFYNSLYRSISNTTVTGFKFSDHEGRVWLESVWGTYSSNTNYARGYARQPRFEVPTERLFSGYLDDPECQRFILGFRYRIVDSRYLSKRPLCLGDPNGDNASSTYDVLLLAQSELPAVTGADIYIEIEIDFDTGIVSRWIDSVRVNDRTISVTRDEFKQKAFVWGDKAFNNNSSSVTAEYNHFALNDFYFMVDTRHTNDGLPSRRLGPIEVEALTPKTVSLPDSWENETEESPHDLLNTTYTSTNVRNTKGLKTDSSGERATVAFEPPTVKDGEVVYCELEIYGYREHGEHVALNTQVIVDGQKTSEGQHTLLPDTLRTMDDAIKPAKLHRTPDGDTLTEENLGKLTLDIWSSKPE